ncbi:MAG: crossover junction endodeoxyribonuclease RuvC [Clostridia bacterium]|nr:crossover junction endodeoxyribonuclease RuvC [Clostridia bacterium]
MIILGIDPGLATVGYGVISFDGKNSKVIDFGVIQTPKEDNVAVRLALIDKASEQLITKFKPDAIAIEELFFNTNVTTGIKVAMARGVLLLNAVKYCGNLYEYTPLQIKQAMVGYGRADKKQVQEMVKLYLKLDKIPRPDDAADALAVALTHAQTGKMADVFRV